MSEAGTRGSVAGEQRSTQESAAARLGPPAGRAEATGAAPVRVTPALTLLFALIGGFAVGNLYWAQPLLRVIADDLGVPTGTAGTLVTFTQIGYALGIVLIVPLGDVANRRR